MVMETEMAMETATPIDIMSTDTPCADGYGCKPATRTGDSVTYTTYVGPVGTVAPGSPCAVFAVPSECVPGYVCIDVEGSTRCTRRCVVGEGGIECAGGESCRGFGLIIGTTEYGYCF